MTWGVRGQAAIAAIRLTLSSQRLAEQLERPREVDPGYPCCRHCYAEPRAANAGACPMADRHTIPCDDCRVA